MPASDYRACKKAGAVTVKASRGWPSLPDCHEDSATANDQLIGWGRPNQATGALGDGGAESDFLRGTAFRVVAFDRRSGQVSRYALLHGVGGGVCGSVDWRSLVWRFDLVATAEGSTYDL